jgi:PAS domain S-box-containing protein
MTLMPRTTVRGKLLRLVLITTAAALGITAAAMAAYSFFVFRQSFVDELGAQADILGLAAAPALEFDDPDSAREYLHLLQARPSVVGAAIYTAKGTLFATYPVTAAPDRFPRLPGAEGARMSGKRVTLSRRIVNGDEILGTIYLEADYESFTRLRDYAGILSLVLVASLLSAALVSSRLQKTVTGPILDMAAMARRVVDERDFSVRAQKMSDDEIGVLVAAFNSMLAELGRRTEVLESSNAQLQREVLERERAEQAQRQSDVRLTTLVSAISKMVWVADAHGGFIESEKWSSYTGQSRDEWQGLGWHAAFDDEGRAALDLRWARALKSREPFEIELKLWHAESARYHYVDMRVVPVLDADGAPREWIGAVQDVDDRHGLEQSLRTLNAELERRVTERTTELQTANKELESFSYSVSHDLRAPIRAIHGFCSLLSRDHAAQLDPEAQRKLGIIKSEAERMGALIDDLLAFSRLGRKELTRAELDMGALAKSVFERLSRDCPGQVELRVGSLPAAVGDRSLFEQVWVNLLSNAMKFSGKKAHPAIEVGAISEEHEHVYYVRDNGAGFDPRYQANLFGVFQRLHHADEFPGTGVGLALVHRIVTRHGGRVWADAKLGEGATFHFTVPRGS